ncbi:MAG: ATP-binding cassette domain-containing protein [Anaerolineaceae bacterium]|nr:ATP-binding cassette domain-containing protein [Anaerolineaceae bacterium]
MNAIELTQVNKSFNGIKAADNLSFQVHEGEIFGLLGPNGAGKSTTVRMITGCLHADSGSIQVFGHSPQKEIKTVRKLISMVPQETNIYNDLSAYDNMLHHAALYCDDLSNVEENIKVQLQKMELWERRKDKAGNYSGGMKRRLVLARGLLHNPQIVLFDEPTLGVDVQVRHLLWDQIKEQQKEGRSFIISTNDMTEAQQLCDRITIIDHGKEIATGTPEELKATLKRDIVQITTSQPVDNITFLETGFPVENISRPDPLTLRFEIANAEAIIADLLHSLNQFSGVQNLHIKRPSLDDVFLHYTGRELRE